jgi:hypothetical protein
LTWVWHKKFLKFYHECSSYGQNTMYILFKHTQSHKPNKAYAHTRRKENNSQTTIPGMRGSFNT